MPAEGLQVSPAIHRRESRSERRDGALRRARRVRHLVDLRAARLLARRAQPLPDGRAGDPVGDRCASRLLRRARRISICCCSSGAATSSASIRSSTRWRAPTTRGCGCWSSTRVTRTIACGGSRRRSPRSPTTRRPVVLASCAADARARENSVHGFFTGALLRQLRRPRRPGARTLDLLDAFNRAADEVVSRTGREPLFSTNGAGRLAHSDPHADRPAVRIAANSYTSSQLAACSSADSSQCSVQQFS